MAHPAFLKRRAKVKLRFFGAGFTLVELIVVIGIIAGGIVAVQTAIQYGLRSAEIAVDSIVAAHLAEEGVELIRNIRDTNWAEREQDPASHPTWDHINFTSYYRVDYLLSNTSFDPITDSGAGALCITEAFLSLDPDGGLYGYDGSQGFDDDGDKVQTKFRRLININNNDSCNTDDQCRNVVSTVCWSDRSGNHEIAISERLYAWRPSPSP